MKSRILGVVLILGILGVVLYYYETRQKDKTVGISQQEEETQQESGEGKSAEEKASASASAKKSSSSSECFVSTFSFSGSGNPAKNKNLFRVAGQDLDVKSVCAKAGGKVLVFEVASADKGISILTGPLATTDSKVTVKYCKNGKNCRSKCDPPKDEFMESIGVDDDGDNGEISAEDAALRAELKELGKLVAEYKKTKTKILQDWEEKKIAVSCSNWKTR